jgi:hypothetical protein
VGDDGCARGLGSGRGRNGVTTVAREAHSGAGGAGPDGLKWLASRLGWGFR